MLTNELADDAPRDRFEEAHPPLTLEMFDDDGNEIKIPEHRLPQIMGWSVLLKPWSAPKKTKGGLLLPDQVQDANDYLTYVFQVVKLGPLAFKHPRLRGGAKQGIRRVEKDDGNELWYETEDTEPATGVIFPSPGDWVIVRKYAGIQLELLGAKLKLCNDDDILAIIDGPLGWKAYV